MDGDAFGRHLDIPIGRFGHGTVSGTRGLLCGHGTSDALAVDVAKGRWDLMGM